MTPTSFKRIPLIFLSTLTLGLAACSSEDSQTPVQQGTEQGILHYGNGTEISDVDPHITTGMPECVAGIFRRSENRGLWILPKALI